MMTADVYDNTGADYNVSKILSPSGTLDPALYAEYSPPYLSATFAFVYGLSFASITTVLVHSKSISIISQSGKESPEVNWG